MTTQDPNHPEFNRVRARAAWGVKPFEQSDEHDSALDPMADIAGNELHAGVGTACEVCGKPIESGSDVRRRVDGGYQHEICPG
jgi:hypothetical protein